MSAPRVDAATEESQADAAKRRAAGEFVRGISGVRNWLSVVPGEGNGSGKGETQEERDFNKSSPFQPEPGRYHLHIAFNCPWCHRVTLIRSILGLQQSITMDVAFPNRTLEDDPVEAGRWEFNPSRIASLTGNPLPECTLETATGKNLRLAKEVYELQGFNETSVPIFYDKKLKRIVSNESAEILRMIATHAEALGALTPMPSLSPITAEKDGAEKEKEAEELNALIYTTISNGAYKAGFSSSQEVYAEAFHKYFQTLDTLEAILQKDGGRKWLLGGDHPTEVDLRLFPTLYRHDPVYFLRMKLNGAKILDYPNLWRWLCRFHQLPGVKADGSNLLHCRQGYFGRSWNNVVPLGPLKPMPYPEAYDHPELAD
uniref:GST C-terminal domain-containing protein n=1 Tax=Chromera velia CCMP2878 TaxID=1169474 RepID=A0A0G4IB64_9ALVE|eukprot:Cvel_12771.t1-p1 / transcript=Cvel_12771.t1 / gene=Cvel_12771 / organism=Chromera_velia_CCMP2878 / gene_product=Glutathionyl-hydroquinone reductase YqjG, putative / transcript_product=Glutathionyl-hydroquinone reductase YqjG, putative / location=Cvel_scaffold849:61182-62294(-) / protein_length=371 / sequence_SO=supercontig / SO=protein_coding / is_pseudo=false